MCLLWGLLLSPALAASPLASPLSRARAAAAIYAPEPLPTGAEALPPVPTTTFMASVSGGLPGAIGASFSAEAGLLPMLSARLTLAALQPPSHAPRGQLALLLGPAIVVDVGKLVPRLFAQAGLAAAPLRPSLAWGLQLDRFCSLHTSVHVQLRAMYLAAGPVRGDLLLGLSYTR